MFEKILGVCPYKSPTDMGVNMVGNAIYDDEAVCDAAKQEIIRRYYKASCARCRGKAELSEIRKIELLMDEAGIKPEDRAPVPAAKAVAERTGLPAVAIQLPDGHIVTGKTTDLLGASSAALLNALKHFANIPDDVMLISREIIEPIMHLKTEHLGSKNPHMHTDELLLALSICAVSDDYAERAMQAIGSLKGSEVHSTVILAHADDGVPVITVEAGELNAAKVGELFWFFELACGISAYVLGVNPFDQPGVELYKRNMFELLGKPGY